MAKKDEIEKLLEKIHKKYGEDSIMRMLANQPREPVAVTPSGCLSLDLALGVGGYPKGRIVEIIGPESSGKTTLTLHAIAEVQRMGGTAAFIDAEHAFDVKYAEGLGVDMNALLFSQPDHGEQALSIVEELVDSTMVDLVVVDSVAALVPKAELEGDMGQLHPGLHARLMSQALRKLAGTAAKNQTTVMFINQLRMKIGVMYGNPEVTTGGQALKFYASVRLDVRKKEAIKSDEGAHAGNQTRVKVIKNKLAPPHRECDLEMHHGQGIDRYGDLLNVAVEHGLVQKQGAWFSYGAVKLGQGFNTVAKNLREDQKLAAELEQLLRKQLLP